MTDTANSENPKALSLDDLIRLLSFGYPKEHRQLTLKRLSTMYSKDRIKWLLKCWVMGKIEAYDTTSYLPVLPPRSLTLPAVSWDYISWKIPLEIGMYAMRGEGTNQIATYGTFKMAPDGLWSFSLHADGTHGMKIITTDNPKEINIPITLKNDKTQETVDTCLMINIRRSKPLGLSTYATYRNYRILGFNKAIRDLAESCINSRTFSYEKVHDDDMFQWIEGMSIFISSIFESDFPHEICEEFENSQHRSHLFHKINRLTMKRLQSIVFDKDLVSIIMSDFENNINKPTKTIKEKEITDSPQQPSLPEPYITSMLKIIDTLRPKVGENPEIWTKAAIMAAAEEISSDLSERDKAAIGSTLLIESKRKSTRGHRPILKTVHSKD